MTLICGGQPSPLWETELCGIASFLPLFAALLLFLSHCDNLLYLQDATKLALKIVTNYALSDLGLTTYAPPGTSLGYMQKSFEVIPSESCPWLSMFASSCSLC